MFQTIVTLLCVLTLLVVPLEARGGRGGGGGGGGGGRGGGGARMGGGRMGGGRAIHRSPSMSRAHMRRPMQRGIPRGGVQRGGMSKRNFTRMNTQRFFNGNTRNLNNLRFSSNRFGRKDFGNRIRRDVRRNRFALKNAFNRNFFDRHRFRPIFFTDGFNSWGWATPVVVGSWLGWSGSPMYYDYSSYEPTYNQPSEYEAPSPVSVTPPEEENEEWMPLGVFALSRETETTSIPNIYMQLALSKQGEIAGVLYNTLTDQTYGLEGSVDQTTQRVAIQSEENPEAPLLETGIYNLTESEAPALVHYADGRDEFVILVRLAAE